MLASLFKRHRCYAQLNTEGVCVAIWELKQQPTTGYWVEVNELQPRWIGKPLPAAARVSRRASRTGWSMLPA